MFKPLRWTFFVWYEIEIRSKLYYFKTILPFLCALAMAHCGQNILHFLTVFELNHVTCFGEWNGSRYNVCPSQQETLSVLCGLAYPLGFLTCNMRSACPRSPLLLQPGSENERQLEQTWLWTVRCHSWHTDLYVREKEMLFVVSHWELGACLLYSIIAATWLTNTRFNLLFFQYG